MSGQVSSSNGSLSGKQEWLNITFRWIKQHVSSCPLFKAGVACCLPTCAQGSSVTVMVNVVCGVFLGFLVSSWCFVHMESASFASLPFVYKAWVTSVCFQWTRPLAGGRWRHYLCDLWR